MTYIRKLNPEFRVRHENVSVTQSGSTPYGRYWFDDTAARLGGTDGQATSYGTNLTGTQTILQDDIGIIRSTTSGVDSGLPPGEYELIYKSLVRFDSSSGLAAPQAYQIVQSSSNYATFTPFPLQNANAYANSSQKGISLTWSDWNSGIQYFRFYDIYWRFSTTGAANGSRSNLRIYNQTDYVHLYNWEDIRIVKLG